MNERIKELGRQASLWCDQNIPGEFSEETMGYGHHWEQKFAELIVRECLRACSKANEIRYPVPPTKGQVVVSCMREIEQHFGVEE
jgi:hypothetical protein